MFPTVLHPALRSQWFANRAPADKKAERESCVKAAEILVTHAAEAYAEDASAITHDTSRTTTSSSENARCGKSSQAEGESWLASICGTPFQPQVSTKNSPPRKPAEIAAEEVKRYFGFEGTPATLGEPLLWWKVSNKIF